jgi:hypothetical protein
VCCRVREPRDEITSHMRCDGPAGPPSTLNTASQFSFEFSGQEAVKESSFPSANVCRFRCRKILLPIAYWRVSPQMSF